MPTYSGMHARSSQLHISRVSMRLELFRQACRGFGINKDAYEDAGSLSDLFYCVWTLLLSSGVFDEWYDVYRYDWYN